MDRLKETLLLRRIRSGDPAAFVETYDFFAPKIYRHALFKTSSPETADDVMSETFLRAWEVVRERAEEIRNLRAFLYRIADNLIIDWYRKKRPEAMPQTFGDPNEPLNLEDVLFDPRQDPDKVQSEAIEYFRGQLGIR